jgi:hypothetical protein
MQVLILSGYIKEMLIRLNHVRVTLLLLIMLDILTASINKKTLKYSPNSPMRKCGPTWGGSTKTNRVRLSPLEKCNDIHLPQ